ncbi:MAG: S-layer homology domain-containing protein [Chloroflexia bacterium]
MSLWLSAAAFARPAANPSASSPDAPAAQNAFAHFVPQAGAPANHGTVAAGTKFTLDLKVNTGGNNNVAASQNYILFDNPNSPNSVLKVLPSASASCSSVPADTTITQDSTTFDAVLQNEVCNGPGACILRGVYTLPGNLAFASGALQNCPNGCGPGDFRIAQITLCAANGGTGTLHWQFVPEAPSIRDTQVIDTNSQPVQGRSLYEDYTITVTGPTATPDRNATPVRTPTTASQPQPTSPPSGGCTMNFRDVQSTDEFYNHIKSVYCRHIVSGYSDNTFRQWDWTMRAQVAKMVVLGFALPIQTTGGPHFTDVQQGTEFYNYIETAAANGIVTGFDNRLFKPWDNVNRAQLAKMIVLAAAKANPSGWRSVNPATPSFTDVPKSNTFYQYVETAKSHNIISGYDGSRFGLWEYAKRGQIAKILDGALVGP